MYITLNDVKCNVFYEIDFQNFHSLFFQSFNETLIFPCHRSVHNDCILNKKLSSIELIQDWLTILYVKIYSSFVNDPPIQRKSLNFLAIFIVNFNTACLIKNTFDDPVSCKQVSLYIRVQVCYIFTKKSNFYYYYFFFTII